MTDAAESETDDREERYERTESTERTLTARGSDGEDGRSSHEPDGSSQVPPGIARAALDAVPDSTAVLDAEGRIVDTNAAWRAFGEENDNDDPDSIGENYLQAADGDDEFARWAVEGVESVLDGDRDAFGME